MIYDGMTKCDLLELLQQARHELQSCKKSLAFKESLLIDLELENADLSEANEKLQTELNCLKRLELRRCELDSASDDGIDDEYEHWTTDEDEFASCRDPRRSQNPTSEVTERPERCSSCQAHALEREELLDQLDELHEQLRVVKDVNKVLEQDVSLKSVQIADLTANLLQKEVREERLEADLEFTAAQREVALRDLMDFQTTSLESRRNSGVDSRSSSIGSSIGEELGLERRLPCVGDNLASPSVLSWEEFLGEPEAGELPNFEVSSAIFPEEPSVEDNVSYQDAEQVSPPDASGSSETVLLESQTVDVRVLSASPTCLSVEKQSGEWNESLYAGRQRLDWRSLICCAPTPNSPIHHRLVNGPKVKKTSTGFLGYLKQRLQRKV